MNIPTRKQDDDLMMEGYDPNDKAYNRTPEEQAEIDKKKAGFDKNTAEYHKQNPYADPLRKYRRKRFRGEDAVEDAEDESVEALLKNQKENKLVWSNAEPKLWTAVSIESGEPKGYYADVIAIGDGKLVASVFDCINIARDEARANGEDFDEEGDTAQHLADFIEDYSATSYTQEIEDAEDVEDEDAEGAAKVAGKVIKGTAKLAGKIAGDVPKVAFDFANFITDGQLKQAVQGVKDSVKYVKGAYEDAEGETLTDQFMRFASKVSALEEGRPVDVDALRLELNALAAKLEALGSIDGVEDAESTNALTTDDVESNLIKKGGFDESEEGFAAFVASRN